MKINSLSKIILSVAAGTMITSWSYAAETPASVIESEENIQAEVNAEVADFNAAFALGSEHGGQPTLASEHHHLKSCKKIQPTEEQKTLLRKALFAYAKDKITLKSEVKLAKLDYAQGILDNQRAAATSASSAITEGVSKLVSSKLAFQDKVLFDILTDAQRKDGFLCMLALKKKYHHHHHGHDHRGHHHGHTYHESLDNN